MADFSLTDEERDRFATFLERSAAKSRRLIAEMEERGGMELKIQKLKSEAISQLIVARQLRNVGADAVEP